MADTIIDNINSIIRTKSELKSVLTENGQNPSDTFSEYPDMFRSAIQAASENGANEEIVNAYISAYLSAYNFIDQDTLSANSYLTSVPNEFITQDELSAMGYLTSVPEVDLSSYVTYSYADNKYFGRLSGIDGLSDGNVISSIGESFDAGASVRGLFYQKTYVPSYAYIESYYATKSYVADYVNTYSPTPDLSSYVTKDELSAQSYLTQHQDLSGYVSKQELSSAGYITSIPNDYATYAAINGMAYITMADVSACGYLTQHQDLSSYASKSYVADYVATYAPVPDLSSYVSKTELSNAGYLTSIPSEYITDSELSACGYITMGDVSSCGYITSTDIPTPDMSAYVSKTELNNASYATTSQIPVINENLVSKSNKVYSLGDSSHLYNKLYTDTVQFNGDYDNSIKGSGNGSLLFNIKGSGELMLTGSSLYPYSKNGLNLGEWNRTFNHAYLSNIWTTINGQEYQNLADALANPSIDLSSYVSKTELSNMGYLTSIPSEYITETELSACGYLTQHQDISGKADKSELNSYVSKTELSSCGYLTQHQDLSGYVKKSNNDNLTITADALTLKPDTLYLETDSAEIYAYNIYPSSNNNYNLGVSGSQWAYTYTKNLILNGTNIINAINGMFSWDSTTQTLTITTIS